jgi:hypothetical protein
MGLRSYAGDQSIEWPTVRYSPIAGIPEITIQGCEPGCVHEWADGRTISKSPQRDGHVSTGSNGNRGNDSWTNGSTVKLTQGAYCIHCGGWRGGLGGEPTVESFIGHLMLVLREMWRCLRDDGVLFWNISDSYSGSGGAHTHDHANPGISNSAYRDGATQYRKDGGRGVDKKISGIRPKNLMGVPQRFFLAAQAEGWIMRSAMPWIKRNGLPDSTTDRPGQVVESIFLMTKNERYFWDPVAVEQPNAGVQTGKAATFKRTDSKRGIPIVPGQGYGTHREDREDKDLCASGTRNFRSSDLFFKTWEGMLLGDAGDPLAMVINPKPFSGAHFAAFAPEIPECAILAGTSAAGVCPHCGAQWRRCVEKIQTGRGHTESKLEDGINGRSNGLSLSQKRQAYRAMGLESPPAPITTGWAPSCTCPAHDPIPATVADFFLGSGTTLMVAKWLGRSGIGVDLSDEYHQLAHERINTPREKVENKRAPMDGQLDLFGELLESYVAV